jgi:hypothetical protein
MSIYKKLLEVQKEVGAISKDSKNPFFKSKYFDINQLIEHVQPVLNKHGLVLTQPIIDGQVFSFISDVENGLEKVSSGLRLPELNDPQKLGSCITYYRRYTLASLLGLQAEDNDGNGLKPKPVAKKKDFEKVLKTSKNLDELLTNWETLDPENKKNLVKLKDELKLELNKS